MISLTRNRDEQIVTGNNTHLATAEWPGDKVKTGIKTKEAGTETVILDVKEQTKRLAWDWEEQQFVIDGEIVGEFPKRLIASAGWQQDEFTRNAWIYEQAMRGEAYGTICRRLENQRPEWGRIDSPQGIKRAAERFADRLGLPHPPQRARGRRRKAD